MLAELINIYGADSVTLFAKRINGNSLFWSELDNSLRHELSENLRLCSSSIPVGCGFLSASESGECGSVAII